ncbi:NAD-dependent epimerase/dehydratase family protein [Streptomyces katsurahamanus]|uniref:NAD-dependent epimerase/dehydratase family protein n=1 Tax=Streptomyces katsurahamanus TaxID=2577098 RepID=A0ABW9NQQ0_9ACTN|nr:NAD-dependent epimerase/dehydratase family protein [Streptomyces katsurahamanus]MQS35640.1 NAD-dependent epimerase/dehydratase family protein [Streptomyces katsurahamanus]
MGTTTVVITGAAGFIGRHVVREAERHDLSLRLTSHRRQVRATAPGARIVQADLTDARSLAGVCEGADVLLHCAAQIGGPAELCEAVNARGTAALMDEARRAGVTRTVQLSTAAVYGRGAFRGERPDDLDRAPASVTSRTRASAEDAVLAAGGIVIRPHLVYGEGDTWVVPALARMVRTLPGTVNRWSARVSAIAAEDLARALVATALAPRERLTASVYHACHPEPLAWHVLLRAVAAASSIPWPDRDLTRDEAHAHLRAYGGSEHDLSMMTSDQWFDGGPLWSALDLTPGPGFPTRFPRYEPWYKEALASAPVAGRG